MVVSDSAKAKEFKGFMSQDLRMPKYEPLKVVKPERDGQLYPEKWPHYSNAEFEEKVGQMVGSMSLFAPQSHEEDKHNPRILLERPVTPVNEEIKSPPTSFNQLVKFVRRRIAAKNDTPYLSVEDQQNLEEIKSPPTSFNQLVKFVRRRIAAKNDTPYLSVEDQQNLAGILMGEINGIWAQVRKQVDDPFMTPEENRELNRRISVYIVTVCERLFKHYLQKATVLNSRGVFSGPANMCRLRAQLALDANKLLNVLTVRRYIVSDMRGRDQKESLGSQKSSGINTAQANPLSFTSLMQSIRPSANIKRVWNKTPTADLEEISAKMPNLDTAKLLRLLEDLPERFTERSECDGKGPSNIPSGVSEVESRPSLILEELSRRLVLDKRSKSLPFLRGVGETLLEELDVIYDKTKSDATYDVADLLTGTKHDQTQSKKKRPEPVDEGLTPGESDLKQLLARAKEIDENLCNGNDPEDLPALLQAMTRSKKHDGLRERLDFQLNELEESQRRDQLRDKVTIREPVHPQPATVTSKLNSQMPVKTSDIRVSERVCMSSVTLQSYATVYNDLQDEISSNMILRLDKNLFLKDEIKEVYKEVMKSVPTDHLKLEQDSRVRPSADQVDLSNLMPSSTLNRRKTSRLINPNLEREAEPPWGEEGAMHWVKTSLSPPKNVKGEEEQFLPATPNMEKMADILKAKNNDFKINDNVPPAVAEKMARTYASWYQWWKNTVSTDDYMKYISTQDTDFLGVSYHFYDSDDPDGVDDPTPTPRANLPQYMRSVGGKPLSRDSQSLKAHTAAQTLNLEREKKLTEMKAEKIEYKDGFWNVNSVLMGGLGKDPIIEEKELLSHRDTPDSDSSRRAKQTLKARAQARQSAKSRRMSEGGPSTSASRRSDSVFSQSYRSTPVLEKPLTPQERLEKVWNALYMPDGHRLDMAIKYSSNHYFKLLDQAMEKWEQVTHFILQRETVLSTLEKFERTASDPNRFFVKGQKGSSAARLDEARERSYYYRKIEDLDDDIKLELDYITNNFNDNVSYKGRPYVDKMKWDRVEMLYWLGEERKHNAIKYESLVKQIPLKTTHLDPILLESRG